MSASPDTEKTVLQQEEHHEESSEKSGGLEGEGEHVETITPNNEHENEGGDLKKLDTHQSVSGNNKYAVKGDNSDGKVVWNWKTRIAAFCLVTLYVGELQMAYCCMKSTL